MIPTDDLLVDTRGGTRWLTLNRPDALNSLSSALVAALSVEVDRAAMDPEVRTVVLTGAGRAFCAGADLKESASRSGTPGAGAAFIRSIMSLIDRLEACPKPTIAAVNGLAVAGGLELVLACDMVYAAKTAVLGDSHANFALFPGGGATVRLPRKIGPNNAKWLMFSGESLPADDWVRMGLVNKTIELAELHSQVQSFAEKLGEKSPLVLARMKEALNDSLEQSAGVALRRERELNELHSHAYDRTEGLTAFRERRPPRFLGR